MEFDKQGTSFWGALAAGFFLVKTYISYRGTKKLLEPIMGPKHKGEKMAFNKSIPFAGGSLDINETGAHVSVNFNFSKVAGGGEVAGFAKANASFGAEIEGKLLADAGLEYLAHAYPALSPLIEGLKSAMDSAIDKV